MAEALLRHHCAGSFEARSAGTAPQPIHPLTLQVLSEHEIDTSPLYSKHVDSLGDLSQFDYVITVCSQAEQACPVVSIPGLRRLSMHFEDPADFHGSVERRLAMFRHTRDQIKETVVEWARAAALSLAAIK
jgi:protein-tyrosine-phosphatase